MNDAQQAALRAEFPASQIGLLPKGGVSLEYVGHGAVTDRLLSVDPEWSWEPLAVDDHGFPKLDQYGNLWIKLTVCGVTRLGVGDGPTMKVLIGDALRNAAMRFGVALDLWVRGQAEDDEKVADQGQGQQAPRQSVPTAPAVEYASKEQVDAIKALTRDLSDDQRKALVNGWVICDVELVKGGAIVATRAQADVVADNLREVLGVAPPGVEPDYAAAGLEPF